MIIASIVLVFFTFISWSLCIYLDYKGKSPFFFLWMLLIVFIYLPLLVNYNLNNVSLDSAVVILFFAVMSQLTYFFSSIFFGGLLNKGKFIILKEDFNKFNLGNMPVYTMYFGVLLVFFLLYLNGIGYSELMNATFLTKREIGFYNLLILIVSAVVLAQSYFIFKTKNIFHIFVYLFFFLVVVLFYKSRSILILGLLPLLYYLIFVNKNKKYLTYVLVVLPLFFISAQFLRALRFQGALNSFDIGRLIDDVKYNLAVIFIEGDFSVINVFFNIIRDCSQVNWCGDYTLVKSIVGVVTQLDGVKTLEYYLYDYYVSPGSNGSLHPTLFGFMYGDFGGLIGFIFFIFLGFLRSYISNYIMGNKYFFIFIGFSMYFVLFMARGSVYNSLIFLFFSFFLIFLLSSIEKFWLAKNEK